MIKMIDEEQNTKCIKTYTSFCDSSIGILARRQKVCNF